MVSRARHFVSEAGRILGYHDLDILARTVRKQQSLDVVVDMSNTESATTAGLARLVVLRRELLTAGGNLRLQHLHGQPLMLHRITRLNRILPIERAQPLRPGIPKRSPSVSSPIRSSA